MINLMYLLYGYWRYNAMDTVDVKDVRKEHELLVLQDHERRITLMEVHMGTISSKMDKVESTIREGNNEQKEMLTAINNRMFDEFFKRKQMNLTNAWKLVLGLLGGGSFLYLAIE